MSNKRQQSPSHTFRTLFHEARNSIYKIIKTDINESKKGHELGKSAKPLGLLAEHPECLWSSYSNVGIEFLRGDSPCRSALTQDHRTAAASCCPCRWSSDFSSKAAVAEKLKTDETNSVANSSEEKVSEIPTLISQELGLLQFHPAISRGLQTISEDTGTYRWQEKSRCARVRCFPLPQILGWSEWGKI